MIKKHSFLLFLFIAVSIICFSIYNNLKINKSVISSRRYESGVSFNSSSFEVVNDMKVGINLGSALDRRDGLNRDIDYFENDPYVIKGKRTKEEGT